MEKIAPQKTAPEKAAKGKRTKKQKSEDIQQLPAAPEYLPWASPYKLCEDGVYIVSYSKEEGFHDKRICSPLEIIALSRDEFEHNWGIWVSLKTPSCRWHRLVIPAEKMIGNGKARMTQEISLHHTAEWRLVVLSSGELSISQKLAEANLKHMAGHTVRVIELPSPAGNPHGFFEELHEFSESSQLSEHLQKASAQYFGTPFRAYIERLLIDIDGEVPRLHQKIGTLSRSLIPPDSDGQVARVAKNFALFCAAGELGVRLGILPWEMHTVESAIEKCFSEWLSQRGGTKAHEATSTISRTRSLISIGRASRFLAWGCDAKSHSVSKLAGYMRETSGETEFLILRDVFCREICLGGKPTEHAKHLYEAGLLVADGAGKLAKGYSHNGRTERFYAIRGSILDTED